MVGTLRFAHPTRATSTSAHSTLYNACAATLPHMERGLSVTSSPHRAAPAAYLHYARHIRDRRLRMAEGRQMAGGAARPLDSGPGYPKISGSGEPLHREPARPYRTLAEEAGRGDARADQGRRFQRAGAGWPVCLFAEIPRGWAA